jgi:hypothetical protein
MVSQGDGLVNIIDLEGFDGEFGAVITMISVAAFIGTDGVCMEEKIFFVGFGCIQINDMALILRCILITFPIACGVAFLICRIISGLLFCLTVCQGFIGTGGEKECRKEYVKNYFLHCDHLGDMIAQEKKKWDFFCCFVVGGKNQ